MTRGLLLERARETIRAAILDGTLSPGEDLPDTAVMAWLGVSRTTLRRAYTDLEHAGLVSVRAHRSVRVACPGAAGADAAFQTLGFVTRGTLLLMFDRDDPGSIAEVVRRLDEGIDAAGRHDVIGLNKAGRRGLVAMAEATDNAPLTTVTQTALDGLWFQLRARQIGPDPYAWDALRRVLETIRDAVARRDAHTAITATERFHDLAFATR